MSPSPLSAQAEEAAALRAELDYLQTARLELPDPDPDLLRRVEALAQPDLRFYAHAVMAINRLFADDLSSAADHCDTALYLLSDDPSLAEKFSGNLDSIHNYAASLAWAEGDHARAWRHGTMAVVEAAGFDIWRPSSTIALRNLAFLELERGGRRTAQRLADLADHFPSRQPRVVSHRLELEANLYRADRRYDAALGKLLECSVFELENERVVGHNLVRQMVDLHILMGDIGRASSRLNDLSEERESTSERGVAAAVAAEVAACRGDRDRARELLERAQDRVDKRFGANVTDRIDRVVARLALLDDDTTVAESLLRTANRQRPASDQALWHQIELGIGHRMGGWSSPVSTSPEFVEWPTEPDDEPRLNEAIDLVQIVITHDGGQNNSEMVRAISHDLSGLVSTLSLIAEASGSIPSDTLAKFIDGTLDPLTHLLELLSVLDDRFLARPLGADPANLRQVVALVVDSYQRMASAKDQTIVLDLDEGDDRAMVDTQLLRIALANLISNAIKYTPQGGMIRVALDLVRREQTDFRVDGHPWFEIHVADNGPGIRPEDRERIFERGGTGAATPTGHERQQGLGLHIVRWLCQLLDARIELRNPSSGHGADFVIVLPSSVAAASLDQ